MLNTHWTENIFGLTSLLTTRDNMQFKEADTLRWRMKRLKKHFCDEHYGDGLYRCLQSSAMKYWTGLTSDRRR